MQLFTAQAAIAIHNAQLYNEVEQQREQLRTLARQLVEAQEEERKDLARELHDQVGQSLTAIDFNLNLISSQLPEDSPASEQIRLQVDASLALLSQAAEPDPGRDGQPAPTCARRLWADACAGLVCEPVRGATRDHSHLGWARVGCATGATCGTGSLPHRPGGNV